jgi:class 3 adenylate cyclase
MVDRLRSASVSKLNNKLIGVNRRLCHHNHQQYDAECRANAERCERLAETLGRTTGRPAEWRGAAKITATRHLATILAAKVAGYSRLMGAGEEGALERLKAPRRELVDPKIAQHHGHFVNTTTYAALASCGTAPHRSSQIPSPLAGPSCEPEDPARPGTLGD